MHSILEETSGLVKSRAKIINKIIEIKGWINNRDKKILNQDLKNQELEEFIKVSIAKGVRSMRTFIIIYLSE